MLAALLCAAAVPGARAQQSFLYACTDRNGHAHMEAEPPAACRDVDVREMNPDGSVRRVIAAPLTRAQRAARDAEEHQKILDEEKERKQESRDRSLLETYGSVDEIEAARQRSLSGQKTLLARADDRIKQYQKEKKRLDDEAEFYEKREMPPKLKDAFASNKALTETQEDARTKALKEMEAINQRYDAEKKRYLELEKMAEEAAAARERMENQGGNPN
jgi:hypothetical protein